MTEPSSSFPERPSLPPSCPTSVRRDPQSLLSPSWWRHGHIPLLVLIASGFAADFMFGTLEGLGIGTALGLLLVITVIGLDIHWFFAVALLGENR